MSTPRPGWTCERGALAYGYASPTMFTKGMGPAFSKLALLDLLDPVATAQDLVEAKACIDPLVLAVALQRLHEYDRTDNPRRAQAREPYNGVIAIAHGASNPHEPGTSREWDAKCRRATGR